MEGKDFNRRAESAAPRIYVASLADYVEGRLHGRWINANQPADDVRREVAEMLAMSRETVAEEWAIHNYENWGRLRLSQHEDLDGLSDAAALIAEYGALAGALLHHLGGVGHAREARRHLESGYRGGFACRGAFLENLMDGCSHSLIAPPRAVPPMPVRPRQRRTSVRATRRPAARLGRRHRHRPRR